MKQTIFRLSLAFLKLGFTAFGGPAAAYAMMRQEFVTHKQWLSEDEFFEFLGIANLIPGPNATEMAMLIGHHHGGIWGLLIAGVCYILPAMMIVLGFSWIYVQFGPLPELGGILYGIKPVILAILASAIWGMVKPRLKNIPGLVVIVVVFIAYLLGVGPLILLIAGGIIIGLVNYLKKPAAKIPIVFISISNLANLIKVMNEKVPFNLPRLFWVFLKAGALMYGSGYVLLAFIYDDLVVRLGWLTSDQLVDAIAIGQVTPGPLSTTATFVGYVMGGVPAALLATLAMFLPSFLMLSLVLWLMNSISRFDQITVLLEGISFAALGLMAGVTWEISGTALVDPVSGIIAFVGLFLLIRFDLDAPWLVLGGAIVGLMRVLIGG